LVRRLPLVAAAIGAGLIAAPAAHAANARVAISNFQWSKPEIRLDLGEHVTWYWTGPDTMHSVTETSPTPGAIDSDPGTSTPNHQVGSNWSHTFDQPGTYEFRCKLHSVVRGTVVVSETPGDPITEPDPIPTVNVDAVAPKLSGIHLDETKFGRRGTILNLTLNEKATVDVEFWRLPKRSDGHTRYAGWQEWDGHIGYNHLEGFGVDGGHLRARPARYRAEVRATDPSHNRSTARLKFTIR
jgi:plastocyanin